MMFTGKEILKITDSAVLANSSTDDFVVTSVVTDSRVDCSGALFVALSGENFDGHDYLDKAISSGATALCVSAEYADFSKVPEDVPVVIVEDTLAAYQALARHHREKMDCTVIGITGSSGKTSTKEILKTILVQAFGADAVLATEGNTNNHVGVPQNLFKLTDQHRFAVIEMGTNHPGEIEVLANTALPDISVISSIGNAHIEFFGDTDGVAKEKSAIFAGYPDSAGNIKTPIAIFPAYGEGNKVLREEAGSELYTFSCFGAETPDESPSEILPTGENPVLTPKQETTDLQYEYLGGNLHGSSFRLINRNSITAPRTHRLTDSPTHGLTDSQTHDPHMSPSWSDSIQWPLQGAYQVSNAAAAALAALAVGVTEHDIEKAFTKCSLPGMRMSITEKDGITWINDAYNANPDSVKATLEWLVEFANMPNMKIILGDMLEIGEASGKFHREVLEYALSKLPQAGIFGVGPIMSKAVSESSELSEKVVFYSDSDEAAKELANVIQSGDMIFLKASRGIKLEKICQ